MASKLLPRFPSAYRKGHSTETAMLRVWSDFLKAADRRHVTLLSLLDMSAAVDQLSTCLADVEAENQSSPS